MGKGSLSKENFKNCLKMSPLYFTPTNIEQIYEDAPKNGKNEVLYHDLNKNIIVFKSFWFLFHFFLKQGPKPKTRFSFKNLYNIKRTEKLIRNEKDLDMEIEYDIGNFFDRKKKFDFKHYDLFRLELPYLRSQEKQELLAPEKSYEEQEIKKQLKEFYILNNQIILDNFQIYAAQEITSKFHPNFQKVQIVDEIIESSFCKFFGITEKKKFEMIVRLFNYP